MSEANNIPKALRSQVEKSRPRPQPAAGDPPAAAPPAAPAAPALSSDLAPASPASPAAPTPTPAPAAPAAAPSPPAPAAGSDGALAADVAQLRQQLNSLTGRYNAETAALRTENSELREKLRLALQGKSPPADPTSPPTAPTSATPDQVKQARATLDSAAGTDIAQAIEVVCKHLIAEAVGSIGSGITQRIEHVESVVHEVRTKTIDEQLADLVPDIAVIEKSAEFLAYLDEPEPFSGQPRANLINGHYARGDVQAVARFFNDFKQRAGIASAAPAAAPAPAPAAAPVASPLAALAVPAGTPGSAPVAPQGPRTWSRATIQQFAKMRGQQKAGLRVEWWRMPEIAAAYPGITGTEAEARALETEFSQATMQGRVQ